MGTNVAEELALNYPERVDHLILYAADAGGSEAIMPSDEAMEQFADFGGSLEERAEGMFKLLVPPDWYAEHGGYFMQIFNTEMEIASMSSIISQGQAMMNWPGCYDRLSLIASDTLLVTGTEDVITPPGNSLLMVEKIPDAWLVQLEGGGHGAMYQYPGEFAGIVLDFLAAP
jgi:pimeloyl-ACP methyl ester carboxylesterase